MSHTTPVGCSKPITQADTALAIQPIEALSGDGMERDFAVACRQARVMGFPIRHTEAIAGGAFRLDADRRAAWSTMIATVKQRAITLLWGDRGVGKTHLATVLGARWHQLGYAGRYGTGRYWTVADLMDDQREWFGKKTGEFGALAEPFEVARDCGLAVLDELNEIKAGSAFDVDSLARIIDARYRGARPTVLITNMRPDKIASVVGGSVVDRIKENGAVIECNWDSVRDAIRAGGEA